MRYLRHSPGFALASMLTLGLGIGAVVAMFSVYASVVLHPVTVEEPEHLVSLYSVNRTVKFVPATLSWPRFEMIRRAATSFSHLGAYSTESVSVGGSGRPPEQLLAERVSGDFFGALRLTAARGRLFLPEDDLPNGPAVCVLSGELWQTRFGSADVVGTSILIDGRSTLVVGILPAALSPPWTDRQIYLPRVFDDSGITPQAIGNGASYLQVVGRLRPGVEAERASIELRGISDAYSAEFKSRGDANNATELQPLTDAVVGNRRPVFIALMGSVAAVLLIACVNVAALFLSRLVSRRREVAVRLVLGASRAAVVRQILGESLTLSALAGIFGVALAAGVLAVVQATVGAELPVGVTLHLNGSAIGVALVAVLASAVVVGLLPALHVTRRQGAAFAVSFDRGLSAGSATRKLRAALLIVETALSVVLLVGASLLLVSLNRLGHTSPGFDPAGVAAAFTNLPAARYDTPERQAGFFLDVLDRLRAMSQVSGAAIVFGLPFHDENYAHPYAVAGRPIPAPADRPRAGLRMVTEDYFTVMRMRLVAGRAFTAADRAGAPQVCIVNESLARRAFAGAPPLGQVILRGRDADQAHEIVGVVADVKTNGVRSATPDEVFYPFRQLPRANAAIVARTTGDPAALAQAFRSAVAEVDADQPVSRFAPMTERLAGTQGSERVLARLTSAFAALAVVLAAIGLYAVLAHAVATRTVEIGVRLAIGAQRASILQLILAQNLRVVTAGIAVGVILAALSAETLASQLYDVAPRAPLVYAGVAASFMLVGLAASFVPALRASRVDPMASLRG